MKPILEFLNVSRAYSAKAKVLDNVTFGVDPGEIVGLVGRNGAGKTTLIRLAMGLLHPDEGSVKVVGHSPTKDPLIVRRRIGYVAETQILPGMATLSSLIGLHKRLYGQWDEALQRQLLDRFDLPLKKGIAALSKGQARQAALLLAVCHRPELLLLDEPAGGLDPVARREFLETAIQLLNREGTSILFSSHHMGDIERLGGRILLLDRGLISLDSQLDTLKEELCLAILDEPLEHGALRRLQNLPGYVHTRSVSGACHVVFRGAPDVIGDEVHGALGPMDVRIVRMPLEDLFVEMVGHSQEGSGR